MKKERLDTYGLMALLAEKYNDNAWTFLEQVANATGTYATNTADAIAMGMWPSRGLEIHGFEVKISRTDLKKELGDPAKAEKIQKYCDFWWLVVNDISLVHDDLPATWGLMAPTQNMKKLKVITKAPALSPERVDKKFLASVIRNLKRQCTLLPAIDGASKNGYEKGYIEGIRDGKEKMAIKAERLEGYIREFQEVSGVEIDGWNRGKIGKAVQYVLGMNTTSLSLIERSRDQLGRNLEILDAGIEELRKIVDGRK